MDPTRPHNDTELDEAISRLVNEFLDRRQAGEELTPEGFAAEHPEVAEELRSSLEGLPLIDRARTLADETAVGIPTPPSPDAGRLPTVEGYQLIEEIGRGGMGVVYRALQVSTKRVVALKVMLAGPFASPTARRRFEREVELAARLQHPSIVTVLEAGRVGQQPYYAMDHVAGVRLDHYLAATQPPPRTTLKLFVQVCEAVEYAHGRGVVHRDLKPANLLIDDQGNPHILDFGLAKATDQADSAEALAASISQPGQVLGTLFYLSPEQAVGSLGQIDARTDVYALGVMLFEALTGSLPFDKTGRPSQVIQRILEAPPIRPASLSTGIDSDVETIILKALEKERARRYQSAQELADDLRRYLAGEPILARRPSGLYVLRKKLRKHRVAATLGTAVLALGLIGLVAGLWWRQYDLAKARQQALAFQEAFEVSRANPPVASAKVLHEHYPRLAEARLVWARALFSSEESRGSAIRFLEDQVGQAPSSWACRALLAELYRAAGDIERADALQARAEREAPRTAEAWYLRSFATLDLQNALRCAQEAVKREPAHTLAWQRLTGLRLVTGDLDGALQGADHLIELGHRPAVWILFKAKLLAGQGRFRRAIEQYTQVITARPGHSEAYRYRAHAYRRVGEYQKAVADYTKAIELAGENRAKAWASFYQRATPLWILGRRARAVEDYRQARLVRGAPFYSDARQYLILREQGRQREADQVLSAALRDVQDAWLRQIFRCLAGQLAPEQLVADGLARDDPEQLCEAYYYAGEVRLLSGQLAQARRWFEKCVQTGIAFDPDAVPAVPMNEYELASWRLETLPAPESRPQAPSSAPTSRPQAGVPGPSPP